MNAIDPTKESFKTLKNIKILYFARLRETLGLDQENIILPENVTDTRQLQKYLSNKGDVWENEFSQKKAVRIAVNQEVVMATQILQDGDEVAFFPPVTGG